MYYDIHQHHFLTSNKYISQKFVEGCCGWGTRSPTW